MADPNTTPRGATRSDWAKALAWHQASDPGGVEALRRKLAGADPVAIVRGLSPIEADVVCRLAGLCLGELAILAGGDISNNRPRKGINT